MPTAKKSLPAKLAEITGELAHVEKKGFNKAQQYAFARESDIAAQASALFAKHNVFMAQSVVGEPRITPLYKTRSGSEMFLTEVVLEVTFYDGDSDATLGPLRFAGAGADTGDKGIYKALTGAEKYALMKTFLIATGDDPEADEKVDKEAASAAAADGSRIKGGAAPASTKKGGKTANANAAQVQEIKRLIKEKEMTAVTFTIAVAEALGKEVDPNGPDANQLLLNLSSEEAGKVIQYISEMVSIVDNSVDELVTDSDESSEDGEQGELAIV